MDYTLNIEVAQPIEVYIPRSKYDECWFKSVAGSFIVVYSAGRLDVYSQDLVRLLRLKDKKEYNTLQSRLYAIANFWYPRLPQKTTAGTDYERIQL